jgi:hypothetical protein
VRDWLRTLLRQENNITGSALSFGLLAIPYGKHHVAFFDNMFSGFEEGSLIVTRPIELSDLALTEESAIFREGFAPKVPPLVTLHGNHSQNRDAKIESHFGEHLVATGRERGKTLLDALDLRKFDSDHIFDPRPIDPGASLVASYANPHDQMRPSFTSSR